MSIFKQHFFIQKMKALIEERQQDLEAYGQIDHNDADAVGQFIGSSVNKAIQSALELIPSESIEQKFESRIAALFKSVRSVISEADASIHDPEKTPNPRDTKGESDEQSFTIPDRLKKLAETMELTLAKHCWLNQLESLLWDFPGVSFISTPSLQDLKELSKDQLNQFRVVKAMKKSSGALEFEFSDNSTSGFGYSAWNDGCLKAETTHDLTDIAKIVVQKSDNSVWKIKFINNQDNEIESFGGVGVSPFGYEPHCTKSTYEVPFNHVFYGYNLTGSIN